MDAFLTTHTTRYEFVTRSGKVVDVYHDVEDTSTGFRHRVRVVCDDRHFVGDPAPYKEPAECWTDDAHLFRGLTPRHTGPDEPVGRVEYVQPLKLQSDNPESAND